ncbi:MAG: hypothetical protein GW875_10920, partial [Deltaproteobacteria bacterium]|nr:hypothetical protein [Deltaproteobacteria bacterium]
MTPRVKMRIAAAIISMGFLTLSGLAFAGTAEPKEASGDQTRKEFSETLQVIKDFAAEQREEAVKQAKIALEEIDAAIENLEERFDRNWDQMDQAARKKSRDTLKSLKKQRNELSEWY